MKSVLISIQPKWVEKIASGEKTIEVRKSRPKIETPFKCYIYCTKNKLQEDFITKSEAFGYIRAPEHVFCNRAKEYDANGKVIGEFVCDKIYDIKPYFDRPDLLTQYECGWKHGQDFDCLSFSELNSYLKENNGYGWHISNLVIYDKPKELREFKAICNKVKHYETESKEFFEHCYKCEYLTEKTSCLDSFECGKQLTRPPQSWQFIEAGE